MPSASAQTDMRSQASNPPPELDGDVGTRDDTGYDYETAQLGREVVTHAENC